MAGLQIASRQCDNSANFQTGCLKKISLVISLLESVRLELKALAYKKVCRIGSINVRSKRDKEGKWRGDHKV